MLRMEDGGVTPGALCCTRMEWPKTREPPRITIGHVPNLNAFLVSQAIHLRLRAREPRPITTRLGSCSGGPCPGSPGSSARPGQQISPQIAEKGSSFLQSVVRFSRAVPRQPWQLSQTRPENLTTNTRKRFGFVAICNEIRKGLAQAAQASESRHKLQKKI